MIARNCTKCEVPQLPNQFYEKMKGSGLLQTACKECARDATRRRRPERQECHDDRIDRQFGQFVMSRRLALGLTISQTAYRADEMPEHRWQALEQGNVRIGVRPRECRLMAKVLGMEPGTLIAIAGGVG